MEYGFGFKIERTKTNLPALWESGGGYSNTGDVTIIAGSNGSPKKPVYVRRAGHLANAKHALIVLEAGDHIIEAYHHRQDFTIRIYRIVCFREELAICEIEYVFSKGEWNKELPEHLKPAVEAAKEKATCYHCREAHYIQ